MECANIIQGSMNNEKSSNRKFQIFLHTQFEIHFGFMIFKGHFINIHIE